MGLKIGARTKQKNTHTSITFNGVAIRVSDYFSIATMETSRQKNDAVKNLPLL